MKFQFLHQVSSRTFNLTILFLTLFIKIGLAFGEPLSLKGALKRLESNNLVIKSYYEKIGETEAKTIYESTLPNPKISYALMNQPFTGPVTPMRGDQIMIKQMVPFPSKWITMGALGRKKTDLSRKRFEDKKSEMIRDLRILFSKIQNIKGQIKWTQEKINLLKAFSQSISAQIRSGFGKGYQLYRGQLFLIEAKQELLEFEESHTNVIDHLLVLLNESGAIFEIEVFSSKFDEKVIPNMGELIQTGQKLFSKKEVAAILLDVTKTESSLAAQSALPDLGLFGAYTFRPKSITGNTSNQWTVGVEIEFPLLFFWNDIPRAQEKAKAKLSAENHYRQVELETEQYIRDSYAKYRKVTEILRLLIKEYLPLTKAIQDSAQTEHSAGRITFDEYINANLGHIQKQQMWQAMRAEYDISLAKLAYVIGDAKAFLND